MRPDVLEKRAKPGETQRKVLELLKASDGGMTKEQVSEVVGFNVGRVLVALERGGFVTTFNDFFERERRYGREIKTVYAWRQDMPPPHPMSEARRAYFREYRARARAKIQQKP